MSLGVKPGPLGSILGDGSEGETLGWNETPTLQRAPLLSPRAPHIYKTRGSRPILHGPLGAGWGEGAAPQSVLLTVWGLTVCSQAPPAQGGWCSLTLTWKVVAPRTQSRRSRLPQSPALL